MRSTPIITQTLCRDAPLIHNSMRMRWIACLLGSVLLLTSCSSALSKRDDYLIPYQQGNLATANESITQTIDSQMPSQQFDKCKDSVWLLLDRATIRFAQGDACQAIADYRLAIDAIDLYSQSCLGELTAQTILQDDVGAYAGEDYEQILARIYMALALLHEGDPSNAYAMLRQAEELQQLKREQYAACDVTREYVLVDNPLGKYLFATLLEKRGDLSNARILYHQSGLGDPDLSGTQNQATVLFLCHNGNAPRKVSIISDATVASTLALEIFLGAAHCHDFALSSLSGVPTPALTYAFSNPPMPTYAYVDGCPQSLLPCYNVGAVAEQQLAQKLPVIVARGAARYILRRSAVYAVAEKNPELGAVMDIGMLIANLNTKADIRSWTTLPQTLDLTRFDLAPGSHTIQIQFTTPSGQLQSYPYQLNLKAGDLCLIHVFNMSPFHQTILIPDRFIQQGEHP
jgi:tetratricopeptide (TPR) repeat protein